MDEKYILPALLILLMLLSACSDKRNSLSGYGTVDADFQARVADIENPEFFEVFADSATMTADQLTAMKFLYAYMPLPDIVDYPGEYFLDNVKVSLTAREQMPWGKSVPVREFMHFVLPVRVNNENLDCHRQIFYEQLKKRVEGMTMGEAVLEVNHWCHEHVTYEPSDSRTHSPLATMCSAIGRCGEESTFTVAALRSIGIPARQVYTPRWAHTDDNHAWVEAWVDGQWHFLGACEPEAVLDLGWFNEPASRGMLMNTRTLGRYDGPEEKLLQTPLYTDINVTENYAAVDTVTVKVVDASGRPLCGVKVDFRLYNYAEFYPVASKDTDSEGTASLVAGMGDLIVWASDGDAYTMQQVTGGKDRNVTMTLDHDGDKVYSTTFDIVPPMPKRIQVNVPTALSARNDSLKSREDSMRMAYVATFVDGSRGNAAVIRAFIDALDPELKRQGQAMLAALTDKDLTDVTAEVLDDAMLMAGNNDDFYIKYVLSPRIENEFLVPFREKFSGAFTESQREAFLENPTKWADWVTTNIKTDRQWQPSSIRMSPWGVWRLRDTDIVSRNIFFVAGARAMGIPARIEPISGRPQYYHDNRWQDVLTGDEAGAQVKKGVVNLLYDKSASVENPQYYIHFTLSKIEDGRPVLLNYPEDADWRNTFSQPQTLDTGEYMLITGQRLADGTVLAKAVIFDVCEGETAKVPLDIRQDTESLKVIGSLNSEDMYYDSASAVEKSLLSTTGRGYYILGIVSAFDEPSNHVLRDLIAKKVELQKSGIPIIMLFPTQDDMDKCQFVEEIMTFAAIGIDTEGKIAKEITATLNLSDKLPVLVIADTFNRIVYASQGYTIGLGQTIIDNASKL